MPATGIFDAHYKAAARVTHNANQSATSGVALVLAFNVETFDLESNAARTMHATVTNNSRLTRQTHKRCTHCQEWLPFSAFRRNKRMKNGLNSWCRKCQLEATQRWRAENREELNRKRREAYGAVKPRRYPKKRASPRKAA